jgi:hypothetical protein
MRLVRRTAVVLAMGGIGLLGLTGCGVTAGSGSGDGAGSAPGAADVAAVADAPEAKTLAAVGFDTELAPAEDPAQAPEQDPQPEPSATGGKDKRKVPPGWRKRHGARVFLRHNTLHGEAVVQTKEGTKTVVFQQGTVTAITDTTVTVKSTDGFSLTWTFADKLHVIEHRTTVQPSAIRAGDEIGVAGVRENDKSVARLVVKRR